MFNEDYKEKSKVGTKSGYSGVYLGIVEDTSDPQGIGRIRVRIPVLHGIQNAGSVSFLSTSALPWAERCAPFYGGYDMGSYAIPPIGTSVFTLFIGGDPNHIVYIGGKQYFNISPDVDADAPYNVIGVINNKESTQAGGAWGTAPNAQETPLDVIDGQNIDGSSNDDIRRDKIADNEYSVVYTPSKSVLFKSLKGHTIVTEDKDEKESISIIDRLGQILSFIGPVRLDKNKANGASRGTRNAIKDNQLDNASYSLQAKAVILLKDVAGQIVRFVAQRDKERVDIISRNSHPDDLKSYSGSIYDAGKSQFRTVTSKVGTSLVEIVGDADSKKISININKGGSVVSTIQITDSSIDIKSPTNINISSDSTINIGGSATTITMSKTLNVDTINAMVINTPVLTAGGVTTGALVSPICNIPTAPSSSSSPIPLEDDKGIGKIIKEINARFDELESKINTTYTIYNTHTHGTPSGPSSTPTATVDAIKTDAISDSMMPAAHPKTPKAPKIEISKVTTSASGEWSDTKDEIY